MISLDRNILFLQKRGENKIENLSFPAFNKSRPVLKGDPVKNKYSLQ